MRSFWKFRGRQGNRRRLEAVIRQLIRIAGSAAVEAALKKNSDRRTLFLAAAAEAGIEEASLVRMLADRLGMPFISPIPRQSAICLPKGVRLSELRRHGAILLTDDGKAKALVCCEPALIGDGIPYAAGVPLALGLWPEIAAALEEIEQSLVHGEGRRLLREQPRNSIADQAGSFKTAHAAAGDAREDAGDALLIEDDPVFLQVLRRFLKRAGISCRGASSIQEALNLIRTAVPAVVICDLHLQHENGLDFLRTVRAEPRLLQLPVIVLSNDREIEIELRVLEAGADAYLRKGEDPRLLQAHIQRLRRRAEIARSMV